MLYNTNRKLRSWAGIKKIILTMLLIGMVVVTCSCSLLTKPLDRHTGFSEHLTQVENNIRKEDWSQAKTSLEESKESWKRLKPLMQLDIDHDYIKDIEDGFIKLDGFLETKDKSNSLVSILLIEGTWENIGDL
jgi:hypothetical protein